MRFEQALQAMRIGKIVRNKKEPEIKFGIDDLLDGLQLWYECKGKKYYFKNEIGLNQKDILSEDWEIVDE